MDKLLEEAERLREALRCAPPDRCAKLTVRLVRIMDELARCGPKRG